ncbi:MAG: tetratricopeptide repeat protein [Candidatus Omnitrophica bacterium]|nr:tetratricopeptide repeat protein [Candidatus Omnitrophota bacterium]
MDQNFLNKILRCVFFATFFFLPLSEGFAGYSGQDLTVYQQKIEPVNKPSQALYSQYLDQANKYMEDGLFPEAKNMIWTAIHLYPDNPDAYINLAIVHMKEGNLEGAKRILKQAGDMAPDGYYQEEILLYNVGLVAFESGEFEDAVQYFTQSLAVYPEFAEAYLYLGKSYEMLGNKTKAFINTFQARYMFQQQNKHMLKRQADELLQSLSFNSKIDPISLSKVFFEKGKLALNENDLEKADYFLQESIYLNPQFTDVYYQLALLYSRQNAPHNAIAYLNRIIEVAPTDTRAYISVAYAYRDLKKYEEALKHLEKALEFDPENFIILYDLGTVYQQSGKMNMAKKYFSQARIKAVEKKNLFLIEKIDQALKEMERKEEAPTRPLRVKKRVLPKESSGNLYPYHSLPSSGNKGSLSEGYFIPDNQPEQGEDEKTSRVLMQQR